jgi:hypothetical protein
MRMSTGPKFSRAREKTERISVQTVTSHLANTEDRDGSFCGVQVGDNNVGSMVGKELSGSKTDSGASTGDYHDFIGEEGKIRGRDIKGSHVFSQEYLKDYVLPTIIYCL